MPEKKIILTAIVNFQSDFSNGIMELPVDKVSLERKSSEAEIRGYILSRLNSARAIRIDSDRKLSIQRGDTMVVYTNCEWVHDNYIEAEKIDVLTHGNQVMATYYHKSRLGTRTA